MSLKKITPEIELKIEEILQNVPELGVNWANFEMLPNRRVANFTKKN